MFGLGPVELLLVFLVIMLLFGAKRLPSLAKGLGQGIKEFKQSLSGMEESNQPTESKQNLEDYQ